MNGLCMQRPTELLILKSFEGILINWMRKVALWEGQYLRMILQIQLRLQAPLGIDHRRLHQPMQRWVSSLHTPMIVVQKVTSILTKHSLLSFSLHLINFLHLHRTSRVEVHWCWKLSWTPLTYRTGFQWVLGFPCHYGINQQHHHLLWILQTSHIQNDAE